MKDNGHILVDEWRNLYGEGWKGICIDAAFQHPAKFSRALIRAIYYHAIEERWVCAGNSVIDPFGGVALGGLDAMRHGLHWIGVELELKFVRLGDRWDCPGFTRKQWRRFYARQSKLDICSECREAMEPGRAVVSHDLFKTTNTRHIPFRATHHVVGNIELWERKGLPGTARLLQGDSRKLANVIREAGLSVSSPPYSSLGQNQGTDNRRHEIFSNEKQANSANAWREGYGESPGQLGAMREGDLQASLIVSSPPYVASLGNAKNYADPDKAEADAARGIMINAGASADKRYGTSKDNLGAMPEGHLRVSSPPFPQPYTAGGGLNVRGYGPDGKDKVGERTYQAMGGDRAEGNLETLETGSVDLAMTSKSLPCYNESREQAIDSDGSSVCGLSNGHVASDGSRQARDESRDCTTAVPESGSEATNPLRSDHPSLRGRTPRGHGQERPGSLHVEGRQGTAILSQPNQEREMREVRSTSESLHSPQGSRSLQQRPIEPSGSLRELSPEPTQNAVLESETRREADAEIHRSEPLAQISISSPPYVSGGHHADQTGAWGGQAQANTKDQAGYGREDGQMGQMKDAGFADACISSPPWESVEGANGGKKHKDPAALAEKRSAEYSSGKLKGHTASKEAILAQFERENNYTYGNSEGQLGVERSNTFWSASRTIVEQLYSVLTPGAHAIFIVKAFVRGGKIIDFPGQWAQLCEAVGFKLLHDHHALLTEHSGTQGGMFGEDKEIKTKRISFFRRLHERRAPETEIFYENVLCFLRP